MAVKYSSSLRLEAEEKTEIEDGIPIRIVRVLPFANGKYPEGLMDPAILSGFVPREGAARVFAGNLLLYDNSDSFRQKG